MKSNSFFISVDVNPFVMNILSLHEIWFYPFPEGHQPCSLVLTTTIKLVNIYMFYMLDKSDKSNCE